MCSPFLSQILRVECPPHRQGLAHPTLQLWVEEVIVTDETVGDAMSVEARKTNPTWMSVDDGDDPKFTFLSRFSVPTSGLQPGRPELAQEPICMTNVGHLTQVRDAARCQER